MTRETLAPPPVFFANPLEALCPKCGSEMIYKASVKWTPPGDRIDVWVCDDCGFGFGEQEIIIGVKTYIP